MLGGGEGGEGGDEGGGGGGGTRVWKLLQVEGQNRFIGVTRGSLKVCTVLYVHT